MTGESFVIRQIDGKGIGVVAIKDIKCGELIISEEPLLVIPWWARTAVNPNSSRLNELEEALCKFVDDLPFEKRQLFMSLSDCKAIDDEEKTELGIWRTNNFALGRTHSKCSNGIFLTIARFNHSCIPSAEFGWNEKAGRQEIRAIRNIKAQEEITLCYFTSKWQLEDAETRKQYLNESYGFFCDCQACRLKGDELEKDQAIRLKITTLKREFDDLVYEYTDVESDSEAENPKSESLGSVMSYTDLCADLHQALSIGLQRLNLMEELGLKCRSRLDFVSELLEVAVDCNAGEVKPLIMQRGLDLATILQGPDHEDTNKWRKKLERFNASLSPEPSSTSSSENWD